MRNPQPARNLIWVVLLAGSLFMIFLARGLLGPLVIAALLAYLIRPIVDLLKEKLRLSHTTSVGATFAAFLLLASGVMIGFAPMLARQVQILNQSLSILLPRMEELFSQPVILLDLEVDLSGVLASMIGTSTALFAPNRVFRIILSATSNIAWVLVILVTTYYLLLDWEKLREWLIALAPAEYQADIRDLHEKIKRIWQAYVRGQLRLMATIGLITFVLATVIGLRSAALIALIAGGVDFIPTLGPVAAASIAALIAWSRGSAVLNVSPEMFTLITIGAFFLIQQLETLWLQPRILGRQIHMNRGVIFVAIIGALTLGSILLALIIVPLVGTLGVIGRYLHGLAIGNGNLISNAVEERDERGNNPPVTETQSDTPSTDLT